MPQENSSRVNCSRLMPHRRGYQRFISTGPPSCSAPKPSRAYAASRFRFPFFTCARPGVERLETGGSIFPTCSPTSASARTPRVFSHRAAVEPKTAIRHGADRQVRLAAMAMSFWIFSPLGRYRRSVSAGTVFRLAGSRHSRSPLGVQERHLTLRSSARELSFRRVRRIRPPCVRVAELLTTEVSFAAWGRLTPILREFGPARS